MCAWGQGSSADMCGCAHASTVCKSNALCDVYLKSGVAHSEGKAWRTDAWVVTAVTA